MGILGSIVQLAGNGPGLWTWTPESWTQELEIHFTPGPIQYSLSGTNLSRGSGQNPAKSSKIQQHPATSSQHLAKIQPNSANSDQHPAPSDPSQPTFSKKTRNSSKILRKVRYDNYREYTTDRNVAGTRRQRIPGESSLTALPECC